VRVGFDGAFGLAVPVTLDDGALDVAGFVALMVAGFVAGVLVLPFVTADLLGETGVDFV
jgi:hypothetical protein